MPYSQGLKPYQTIQKAGESEIVISKSRFLGYSIPVSSELQVQDVLAQIRKKHHDAKHCCYAFRLNEGSIVRSSDDGEPSGTAGAPILNVLSGAEVENVLCAVIRYFGGVLLGTGGLVRAYGRAASEALVQAGIVQIRVCERILVTMSYSSFNLLEPTIRKRGYPCETVFADKVALTLLIPAEESDALLAIIIERTDGGAQIMRIGQSLEAYTPSFVG